MYGLNTLVYLIYGSIKYSLNIYSNNLLDEFIKTLNKNMCVYVCSTGAH